MRLIAAGAVRRLTLRVGRACPADITDDNDPAVGPRVATAAKRRAGWWFFTVGLQSSASDEVPAAARGGGRGWHEGSVGRNQEVGSWWLQNGPAEPWFSKKIAEWMVS